MSGWSTGYGCIADISFMPRTGGRMEMDMEKRNLTGWCHPVLTSEDQNLMNLQQYHRTTLSKNQVHIKMHPDQLRENPQPWLGNCSYPQDCKNSQVSFEDVDMMGNPVHKTFQEVEKSLFASRGIGFGGQGRQFPWP